MSFRDDLIKAANIKEEPMQDLLNPLDIQMDIQSCVPLIEELCAGIRLQLIQRANKQIIAYDIKKKGILNPKAQWCNPKYVAFFEMGYQFDYANRICRMTSISYFDNDITKQVRGVICNSPEIVIGILSEIEKRLAADEIWLAYKQNDPSGKYDWKNGYFHTERISLGNISNQIRRNFQTQATKDYWDYVNGHKTPITGYCFKCQAVSFVK